LTDEDQVQDSRIALLRQLQKTLAMMVFFPGFAKPKSTNRRQAVLALPS
jgi:hypothetical protein